MTSISGPPCLEHVALRQKQETLSQQGRIWEPTSESCPLTSTKQPGTRYTDLHSCIHTQNKQKFKSEVDFTKTKALDKINRHYKKKDATYQLHLTQTYHHWIDRFLHLLLPGLEMHLHLHLEDNPLKTAKKRKTVNFSWHLLSHLK